MGPLSGCRVVELAGIGPGPFAGMILADLGAEVVRVDRPAAGERARAERFDVLGRGKKSVVLDLKRPEAVAAVLDLVAGADALIEGYRPGVTERLGLGPAECLARNPRLVYGRMTGWGQDGPLAQQAGHDIAYIALTGALHAIGEQGGPPQIPLNLLGDFGGGSTYLVIGVLAALWAVRSGAPGQVVDAAIVDGAAHLLAMTHGMLAAGAWADERGVNLLDGGAPFYAVYATADGRHMAVGALEPKFYAEFLARLGLDEDPARQHDRNGWAALRGRIAGAFATRTQAEWTQVFSGSDACVAPVLGLREAADHPHIAARGTLVTRDGVLQPAPAPRFSATPAAPAAPPPAPGQDDPAAIAARWRAEQAAAGPATGHPAPRPAGVNQRALIRMTDDEVSSFLEQARTATIATIGPGGFPHAVAMWYGLVGGRVYFETKAKSQKAVNLRRDPRISFSVEAGESYDQLRGVAVEGLATIIDDASSDEYWAAAVSVFERYQGTYTEAMRPLVEQMMNKRVVVRVDPVRVRSWDHRKLGLGALPVAGTTAKYREPGAPLAP
jgi:alpha-methylacyl-CoA racemase